jgi:hypothetical protein
LLTMKSLPFLSIPPMILASFLGKREKI